MVKRKGWPGVYAVGDVAAVPDRKTGRVYPPNAFVAFTQGRRAASNIVADLRGEPSRPYHYEGIDSALLTKGYALVEGRGLRFDGWLASIVWRLVFLAYIQTWQRRIALVQEWFTGSVFPRDITQLALARSDALAPMRFGAGEIIIRAGDPGNRFYIITTGEVEVVRHDADGREERVARLGPGQYFGEIALLTGVRRTATIRATVDTTVLSMARQHFSTLVEHMPDLRDTFERTAGDRAATAWQDTDHDR